MVAAAARQSADVMVRLGILSRCIKLFLPLPVSRSLPFLSYYCCSPQTQGREYRCGVNEDRFFAFAMVLAPGVGEGGEGSIDQPERCEVVVLC